MLLQNAVDLFITCTCAGKTNATPSAYRKKLKRMVVFLGDRELESITAEDLEKYRVALLTQSEKRRGSITVSAPLSVWYIRGVLRVCKQFFKWCYEAGHLPGDWAENLKLPKAPQMLPKAIEQNTFDKLLTAALSEGDVWARYRNVCFLCLLRDTGGRLGGLLSAVVGDVDLLGGTLAVTEKGKSRLVFFNTASKEALTKWLDVRQSLPVSCENLFVGRGGGPLRAKGVYSMLNRLADSAGLSGLRYNPHSFRHAFARDSLRAGADLSQVSQMMGHSGLAVTSDYYARWLPSELKEVHEKTSPGAAIDLGGEL